MGPKIPWTESLTDACENITFPQLRWRAVIIHVKFQLPHTWEPKFMFPQNTDHDGSTITQVGKNSYKEIIILTLILYKKLNQAILIACQF